MSHRRYFKYEEFTYSEKADTLNIDNTPDETAKENINELMEVMDKIRAMWTAYCNGNCIFKPEIYITSGFRCEALNEAVGGSKTSAHKIGSACDFKPRNGHLSDLFMVTQQVLFDYGIPFDQLIFETKGNSQWIHLGLQTKNGERRYQIKSLKS